jgi:hypothetical protein
MRAHAGYTLDIWRAVRAAAGAGLSTSEVRGIVAGRANDHATEACLQNLRVTGYLRFEGITRWGRWHLGTEVPPAVLAHERQLAQDDGEPVKDTAWDRKPLHKPVSGVPQGVPNSIFSLAATQRQQSQQEQL